MTTSQAARIVGQRTPADDRGRPTPPASFPDTSDYLLETGRPDDVAVVDGEHRYTYRDLRTAAGHLAAELADLRLPAGSRVGILASNSFFWVAAYLAAMKGNVAVPFSDKANPEDVQRQAAWVGCAAVLMDRQHQPRCGAAFGSLPIITEGALGRSRQSGWPKSDAVDPDADAVLMFTSGTTSGPKAVRVTHRNIQANTESIVLYLGLRRDDRMLVVLPFFYCYGASLMHTHLRVGGSLVLCSNFVFPELALDLIERERCTGLAGIPSSFQLLLRASSFSSRELPSLRLIQQAGGRLPPTVIEDLAAAKPNARLFVMYGQTEATARLSYLPPERVLGKLGSIGRGIPGVELRVVNDDGRPVAIGETGEIIAYGDSVSPGYYNDPQESATKFRDGALWTGDLAVVDADGYIFIVDRRADFIKSWGHRVSSLEVEAAALRLKDLVLAAAIGVPDPEAGEAITLVATVRPGSSVDAGDVLATMRTQLPRHMAPRSVHLVETMPLTASGKIAKAQLREALTAATNSR
jgi:acyl-CoA synthetase (AMP-forming)/AMP-acid ligase II